MTAGPSIPSSASSPSPSKHSTIVPPAAIPEYLIDEHGAKDSMLAVSFLTGAHAVSKKAKIAKKRFIENPYRS
jgi:hypothetical protein